MKFYRRTKMDHNDEILNLQFKMTDKGRIDRIGDLYTTYNPSVDIEALRQKGYLLAVEKMMEPVTMSFDDHDPKVIAYWAKLGMVKEFHGENVPMSWSEYECKTGFHWEDTNNDGPQNLHKQWTSFVPVSAFQEENRERRYPTVIVLHGGFNPKSIIDGWGFPQEAAKREWIVLAPSLELSDLVEEMLIQAEELYPVDPERVYITGFSYGGFMSDRNALERPELFAAAGPCGAPIGCNDLRQMAHSPEPMRPFDEKKSAHGRRITMPVMNCYGNLDGNRFPIFDSGRNADGPVHYQPEELVNGINFWCEVNDAEPVSLKEVMELRNRADVSAEEQHIGIPLASDCHRTIVADGITNYIGDIRSRDGVVRMRIMCEMNMPHWPAPEMIRQLYDFFEPFSRRNGESYYNPVRSHTLSK